MVMMDESAFQASRSKPRTFGTALRQSSPSLGMSSAAVRSSRSSESLNYVSSFRASVTGDQGTMSTAPSGRSMEIKTGDMVADADGDVQDILAWCSLLWFEESGGG